MSATRAYVLNLTREEHAEALAALKSARLDARAAYRLAAADALDGAVTELEMGRFNAETKEI